MDDVRRASRQGAADELNRAGACGGWRDLYRYWIGPDHQRLYRLCPGRVVHRGRERFDRLVVGGILQFHAARRGAATQPDPLWDCCRGVHGRWTNRYSRDFRQNRQHGVDAVVSVSGVFWILRNLYPVSRLDDLAGTNAPAQVNNQRISTGLLPAKADGAGLHVQRRGLAQKTEDIAQAHRKGSPVDKVRPQY